MKRIFLPIETILETKYPGITYKVTDQVSQGSSSLIYRVRKSNSDRSVILKELFPADAYGCHCERSQDGVVRPSGGRDSEIAYLRLKEHFFRENVKDQRLAAWVNVLAGMEHAGICRIILPDGRSTEVSEDCFILLEDAGEKGGGLFPKDLIQSRNSPLPFTHKQNLKEMESGNSYITFVASVMTEILREIVNLHRHHYAHLDLQHGNIFLQGADPETGYPGRACLLDLATAEEVDDSGLVKESLDAERYSTLFYMAPEFRLAKPLTLRADLYSLGAIFVYLLTEGEEYRKAQIFSEENGVANYLTNYLISEKEAERLGMNGKVREYSNRILKDALNSNPQKRFSDLRFSDGRTGPERFAMRMMEAFEDLVAISGLPDVTRDLELTEADSKTVHSLPLNEKLRYIELYFGVARKSPRPKIVPGDYVGIKRDRYLDQILLDSSDHVLILADPGFGKTWLLAKAVERMPDSVFFFCDHDNGEANDVDDLTRNLAIQLAKRSAPYRDFLLDYILMEKNRTMEKKEENIFHLLITAPLIRGNWGNERVTIVIDAVDELINDTLTNEKGERKANTSLIGRELWQLMAATENLPIRLLVSARPYDRIIHQPGYSLTDLAGTVTWQLSEANEDCEEYIREHLRKLSEETITRVICNSHGMFLYARFACRYLADGGSIDRIPGDLNGFYFHEFERMGVADTPEERNLLKCLYFGGRIPREIFEGIYGAAAADALKNKIRPFLDYGKQCSFFHRSLYEWLESENAGGYRMGTKEQEDADELLAVQCLKRYDKSAPENLSHYELTYLSKAICNRSVMENHPEIMDKILADDDLLRILKKEVESLRRQRDYHEAYIFQKAVMKLAEKSGNTNEVVDQGTLFAEVCEKGSRFSESIQTYRSLIRKVGDIMEYRDRIPDFYIRIATIKSITDREAEAFEAYDNAIRTARKNADDDTPKSAQNLIRSMSEKGWALRKNKNRLDKTMECFEEIERLPYFRPDFSDYNPENEKGIDYDSVIGRYLIVEMSLLWTLIDLDIDKAAPKKYEEIRDLYDRYRDQLSVTYYSQWYYISYVYFYNRKDYPSAFLAAEKALKLREGTSGTEFSNSVDYLIAYTLCVIRLVDLGMECSTEAIENACRYAVSAERVRKERFGVNNRYYTFSLDSLWQTRRIRKEMHIAEDFDIEAMEEDYRKIIQIREDGGFKDLAAYACRNCGFNHEKLGNYSKAEEWYREAADRYSDIGEDDRVRTMEEFIERVRNGIK